jgi:formate dehydrogenase iron-sulfur subunit
MAEKAFLYDATRCTACRGCQVACKQWNEYDEEIPTVENGVDAVNWGSYENPPELSAKCWLKIKFTEVERNNKVDWLFTRISCMHCTEASCQNVCPTNSISHTDDGFVVIDQEWCIGCGYCVQACPYGVPHKDEHTGTARKCTSCIDRRPHGYPPACIKACPPKALLYDDRSTLLTLGRQRVQDLKDAGMSNANLYGENELGGLNVLYVLDDSPEVYGLPAEPKVATHNAIGQWIGGLLTAGLITALPFWFIIKRKNQIAAGKNNEGGAK